MSLVLQGLGTRDSERYGLWGGQPYRQLHDTARLVELGDRSYGHTARLERKNDVELPATVEVDQYVL